MASVKPIAIVSPMKKPRKPKKRNKSSPRKVKNSGKSISSYYDSESEKSFSDRLSAEKKSNRLCSMFENLNLFPDVCDFEYGMKNNSRAQIPEHDRKILDRMAAKMKKDLSNIEIAHQAHLMWENERASREKLQKEQETEYNTFIQTKRRVEKDMYDRRFQEFKEIYDWEKDHLRDRLSYKENAAARRIKALENQRNKEVFRKHEIAQEKARHAVDIIREHKLAEVLWRRTLAQNLEVKTNNTGTNRDILLKYCRQKAVIDNRVHQEIQRRNWEEQRFVEMEQLSNLKRRLAEKNRRMQRIATQKENFVRESRKLADSTSKLRENLKRSLSPDVFTRAAAQSRQQSYRPPNSQICFTPNSFESHIRLG